MGAQKQETGMTFRERCSCGAEFECSEDEVPGPVLIEDEQNAAWQLAAWRERHEKVCPNQRRAERFEEIVAERVSRGRLSVSQS